jgi:small subunit ribosomal protein S6
MPIYETVYITRADLTPSQNDELVNRMTEIVKKNGGAVKNKEYWGLRTLAYQINKGRKGHYTMLHLDAPAPAKAELERNLRLEEDVLRFMTIKLDELPKGQSPMMKRQHEGEAA